MAGRRSHCRSSLRRSSRPRRRRERGGAQRDERLGERNDFRDQDVAHGLSAQRGGPSAIEIDIHGTVGMTANLVCVHGILLPNGPAIVAIMAQDRR
jgi:hypothetical protein